MAILLIGATHTDDPVSLWVPILFSAWGVFLWFGWGRPWWRDPYGETWKVAEQQARNRTLHPFGGGDVEESFRIQWRMRWVLPLIIVSYPLFVIALFVQALRS